MGNMFGTSGHIHIFIEWIAMTVGIEIYPKDQLLVIIPIRLICTL